MSDFRVLTNSFPIRETYRGIKYVIWNSEKWQELKAMYDQNDKLTERVRKMTEELAPTRATFLHYYRGYGNRKESNTGETIVGPTLEEATERIKHSMETDIDWFMDRADVALRSQLEALESLQEKIKARSD